MANTSQSRLEILIQEWRERLTAGEKLPVGHIDKLCDMALRSFVSETAQRKDDGLDVDDLLAWETTGPSPFDKTGETPRTDAIGNKDFNPRDEENVMRAMREWAALARQLERELAAATRGWPKDFPLGSIRLKGGEEMAIPAVVAAYILQLSTQESAVTPSHVAPHFSDFDIRRMWRAAGGDFHGPNIETATMPEANLFRWLREFADVAVKRAVTPSSTRESWIEEELKDGDRICEAAGVQRTEGGRLPVHKIINAIQGRSVKPHRSGGPVVDDTPRTEHSMRSATASKSLDAEGMEIIRQYVREMEGVLNVLSARGLLGDETNTEKCVREEAVRTNIAKVKDYLHRSI